MQEWKNFRDRIDILFDKVKARFREDNIFEDNDILQLNDRCLSFAVAELQKYSLLETNVDIKGVIVLRRVVFDAWTLPKTSRLKDFLQDLLLLHKASTPFHT